jgi:hypothetical protein
LSRTETYEIRLELFELQSKIIEAQNEIIVKMLNVLSQYATEEEIGQMTFMQKIDECSRMEAKIRG